MGWVICATSQAVSIHLTCLLSIFGTCIHHTQWMDCYCCCSMLMDYIPQLVYSSVEALWYRRTFQYIDVDSISIYKCTGKRFLASVCYQVAGCSHILVTSYLRWLWSVLDNSIDYPFFVWFGTRVIQAVFIFPSQHQNLHLRVWIHYGIY